MLLALAQTNPIIGKIEKNLEQIISIVSEGTKKGAELIVFPEAALTGYCYESKAEAFTYIPEDIAKKASDTISSVCGNSIVLLGLLEKEQNHLYNNALVISSKGILGRYSKSHLPFLGADRFVTRGMTLDTNIFTTPYGKIGILICYELRFPEVARVLSLKGVEIVCDMANLPVGGESNIAFIGRSRALENKIFLALCNRCGVERNVQFIGKSQIVNPSGDIINSANEKEEIIYSNIDLSLARNKSIINKPKEYEMHLFRDRRPDLYCAITD